jgi:hypothetical protein
MHAAGQLQHLLPDLEFITLLLLLCSTILLQHLVVRVMVNLQSQQLGRENLHRVQTCLPVLTAAAPISTANRTNKVQLQVLQMKPTSTAYLLSTCPSLKPCGLGRIGTGTAERGQTVCIILPQGAASSLGSETPRHDALMM